MTVRLEGRATSRGFSMIEVLIALLVIAIGVLGAVALQSRAVQAGMETYQRTQALLLVEDMVSRMRNNKANVSTCYAAVGSRSPGFIGTGAALPSACEDRADLDLEAWNQLLLGAAELSDDTDAAVAAGGIIEARGCIKADSSESGAYRVSVAWKGLSTLGYDADRDTCGKNAYESESYRRVVGVTVRITDLR